MDQYLTKEISSKANKWQGRNICRWSNKEYDALYAQVEQELDPAKQVAMFIKLNDMPCKDNVIIPLISRPRVRGTNLKVVTRLSGWDLDLGFVQEWFRDA
jgi:peptide/nickel transport system substrate-binding protein